MNKVFYPLSDEIKKQLGMLIKGVREIKYQDFKEQKRKGTNPYSKINLIEQNRICHYNTYLKLENDLVKDDAIYYKLLDKLDLNFQVNDKTHRSTMELIMNYGLTIIRSIEYFNSKQINEIIGELEKLPLKDDCIANAYYELITLRYELMYLSHISSKRMQKLNNILNIFKGLYHAIAINCIAIDYVNQNHSDALTYLDMTKKAYADYQIHEGILIFHYLRVHYKAREYYNLIDICNRYEQYFHQTKNDKRLIVIYFYLSQYYSNIHHMELAVDYHNKALQLVSHYNDDLGRYYFVLFYDFGYQLFKHMRFKDALEQLEKALHYCEINIYRFEILVIMMILNTYNHENEEVINKLMQEAEIYYELGNEVEQLIYKYFKYKFESPNYYRRYSFEQLIPVLKQNTKHKDYLLFIYHDLYI
jgi:hypothetical protein